MQCSLALQLFTLFYLSILFPVIGFYWRNVHFNGRKENLLQGSPFGKVSLPWFKPTPPPSPPGMTETPIIERTYNTIDPLTAIYGPEIPENPSSTEVNTFIQTIDSFLPTIPPIVPLSIIGLTTLALLIDYTVNYARSQIFIAELYSGIPKSVVDIVELDAVDPKTIFYIPKNTTFIGLNLAIFDSLVEQMMYNSGAAVGQKLIIPEKRQKEMQTYEYLIEQAINQVNIDAVNNVFGKGGENKKGETGSGGSGGGGVGVITGKARFRTSELSTKSSDCVISINAFQRLRRRIQKKFKEQTVPMQKKLLDDEQRQLFKEIYRILRPGGLFCFYEAIEEGNEESNSSFLKYVNEVFPKEIKTYVDIDGKETTSSTPSPPPPPPPPAPASTSSEPKKWKKINKKPTPVAVIEESLPTKKEVIKPGIVFQIRSTLPWRKYIIGIAIKPFQ